MMLKNYTFNNCSNNEEDQTRSHIDEIRSEAKKIPKILQLFANHCQFERKKPEKLGFQGWAPLMKKFNEDSKIECKALTVDRTAKETEKVYPTGSKHEGTADVLGLAGYGTYTLSNGVIYEGDFEDGMFQGDGTLTYPSGIIIKGIWNKGAMTERTLYFADGLKYSEDDWDYCKMPDRRFSVEYDLGVQPAGHALLTAEQPTRDIPPEHCDTSDGFFDLRTKAVYKADDLTALIRCPLEEEQNWIIDNCRVHENVPLGPRENLYEEWPEPELNYGVMQMQDAKSTCGAAKSWGFEGDKEDDGWRLKFSQSKARLSIVATRSVAEFGARQQKTRFRWGGADVDD